MNTYPTAFSNSAEEPACRRNTRCAIEYSHSHRAPAAVFRFLNIRTRRFKSL